MKLEQPNRPNLSPTNPALAVACNIHLFRCFKSDQHTQVHI